MKNIYAAFKDTEVKTASQGKLIVLLYQGAIKALTDACDCFTPDEKIPTTKIESFGQNILKAQDIINELQVSLDTENGGQIAKNLMSLYVFFNSELMTANIAKDKSKIDFVLKMLKELLVAWDEAAKISGTKVETPVQRALNIIG